MICSIMGVCLVATGIDVYLCGTGVLAYISRRYEELELVLKI